MVGVEDRMLVANVPVCNIGLRKCVDRLKVSQFCLGLRQHLFGVKVRIDCDDKGYYWVSFVVPMLSV